MMTVPMDSATVSAAPPGRELVQRLLKKKIELENSLRKAEQSKVPSDPVWLQLRENYEALILADHELSEKHGIESQLWRLHYSRIQHYRGQLSNQATGGAVVLQGPNNNVNLDRIRRLKSSFKSFLTEATGFYHELMTKISSKYGLSMGYFSKGPDVPLMLAEDDKRASDIKRGSVSCHRCLIYLGDLARYKGTYGDGDSASEYAAAESYYKQAAYLCPSSGNPHNQLATLAALSNDELMALYQYFRGYVIEDPFPIARENLTMTFEKNRHRYSQLLSNKKVQSTRIPPARSAGRGRGRGGIRYQAKDAIKETSVDRELNISEVFKAFCTGFVRLNGILFTKTSLETFEEVLASVINDLHVLISSGPEEELNFGAGAFENALTVVRIVAILISSVYNAKKESEGKSYAEIVNRSVLLQNAFTVSFKFVGCILKRCMELSDAASCFYLPAIMVYIEWLACHPDIATVSDMDELQASARLFFWNHCVSFLNKLILTGLGSVDGDDDETCFFDMGTYDERETGNRLALWEDSELRGFLPLMPAHLILDFSRKHEFGNDGGLKEKKARIQRILAAGKALANCVIIDKMKIYIEPISKTFVLASEPPAQEAADEAGALRLQEPSGIQGQIDTGIHQSSHGVQLKDNSYSEADEDEEIVFRPVTVEKTPGVDSMLAQTEYPYPGKMSEVRIPSYKTQLGSASLPSEPQPANLVSSSGWTTNGGQPFAHGKPSALNISEALQVSDVGWVPNGRHLATSDVSSTSCASGAFQSMKMPDSRWLNNGALTVMSDLEKKNQLPVYSNIMVDMPNSSSLMPHNHCSPSRGILEQEAFISTGLKNINLSGNGLLNQELQSSFGGLQSSAIPHLSIHTVSSNISFPANQLKSNEATIPSSLDSVVSVDSHGSLSADPFQAASKKNPVGRPVRHVGPPPGFNHVASRRQDDLALNRQQLPQMDDYSWLDGYQPSSRAGNLDNHVNQVGYVHPSITSAISTPGCSAVGFPFPGKHVTDVHSQVINENTWQDFHLFEPAKQNSEQKIQQGNWQGPAVHTAQSLWSGRYFV